MPTSDEIDPLTRLAIKHGTDKWGVHFYAPVYHALFAPLRDKPIRLLEIGVGGYRLAKVGGASLAVSPRHWLSLEHALARWRDHPGLLPFLHTTLQSNAAIGTACCNIFIGCRP
jgi:hypothetical protein